jgi:hypothetical protein
MFLDMPMLPADTTRQHPHECNMQYICWRDHVDDFRCLCPVESLEQASMSALLVEVMLFFST